MIYRRQSKWVESTKQLEKALAVDPLNFGFLNTLAINYDSLNRYPEKIDMLDRILTIVPDDLVMRLRRAFVDVDWRADTRPLHDQLANIRAKGGAQSPDFALNELFLAWLERDNLAFDRTLAVSDVTLRGGSSVVFSRSASKGLMALACGQKTTAERAFRIARKEQEDIIAAGRVEVAPALCVLGLIDAFLGNKEEAIQEGRQAVQLLPVTLDPFNGQRMIQFLGVIYAWVGEPSLACDQIEIASKLPGEMSYGDLRLNPLFDPLRGNPRFEKIVASLAPSPVK